MAFGCSYKLVVSVRWVHDTVTCGGPRTQTLYFACPTILYITVDLQLQCESENPEHFTLSCIFKFFVENHR